VSQRPQGSASIVAPNFAAAAAAFLNRAQLSGSEVQAYIAVLDTLAAIQDGRLEIVTREAASEPKAAETQDVAEDAA
jgi:hypothetical protein